MREIRSSAAVLWGLVAVIAGGSVGCRQDRACRDNTLFLSFSFDDKTMVADTLEVALTTSGQPMKPATSIARTPNRASDSLEVSFSSYPVGATVTVSVTALITAGGSRTVLGTIQQTQVLGAGCAAFSLVFGSAVDGGTDGVATDGGMDRVADVGGTDLAVDRPGVDASPDTGGGGDGATCTVGLTCTLSNLCHVGRTQCAGNVSSCGDTGQTVFDGTACGDGMTCAAGVCTPCVMNASCPRDGQPCKLGTTSCATGSPICMESGNASDGLGCGTDMVCSTGACVTCSDGSSCVPANTCHKGTLDCSAGTPKCNDTGALLDDGSTCGTDMVCSLGTCMNCKVGQDCTITGEPCRTGTTTCNTGLPVCMEAGNAKNGLSCDTGKVCDSGACVICMAGSTCVPANLCHKGMLDCSGGTPVCNDSGTAVDNGTTCGTDQVCNAGACGPCAANQDCTPTTVTCRAGKTSCSSGQSVCAISGNAANGATCGTNMVCSDGDCNICAAGTTCTPTAAPCHAGKISCTGGAPTCIDQQTNLTNGTSCGANLVCSAGSCQPCTEGAVCTYSNPCQNGAITCVSGTPVCQAAGNMNNGKTCGTNMVCNTGTCVTCQTAATCTPTGQICHNGSQSCTTGSPTCSDLGTFVANGTSCGANLACSAGSCSCTTGGTCTPSGMPCSTGTFSCTSGTSTCVPTGNAPDATVCAPGETCQSGSCLPNPGCPASSTTPSLGCPCSPNAALKCNPPVAPALTSKLPLACQGGVWVALMACDSAHNCDSTSGSCAPIIPQCMGKSPGFAFCDFAATTPTPLYQDVRKTCGIDLVSTTQMTCSGICDATLGCQNPRCGDLKVEGTEQCDDGNTVALDGCEPATAASGAACTKSQIVAVSAGTSHTCARFNGGYARCWGANDVNQLGLGHTQFEGTNKPYQLTVFDSGGNPLPAGPIDFGGLGVTSIVAGSDFSCAILTDQTVRCWGKNDQGQLGLGNTNIVTGTPNALGKVDIGGLAQSVVLGSSWACALLTTGGVHCWGSNTGGRLGTGTITPLNTSTPSQIAAMFPTWVSLGNTATAIGAGGSSTCARLTDGSVRCWGDNGSGQLGTGMSTQFSRTMVPSAYSGVLLPAAKTATSISVGSSFGCVRLSDATAECWGDNTDGQLGIGGTGEVGAFDSPAADGLVLTPGTGVDSIFAGIGLDTCAFFANGGGLHCWGDNSKGQLGYPDLNNRGNTPQNVPSIASAVPAITFGAGLSAVSFSMGFAHACALLNTGELRCWGWNNKGQLGMGNTSAAPNDFVGGSASTTPNNAITSVPVFPP
jgi:alpha-tubulin suppressor-like RCC1 family protein